MARFAYRMQNILDIKTKLEAQEKIAFGLAQAKLNDEQDKLRELLIRRADYERQLKEGSQGMIDVKQLQITRASIDAMKSLIRDQMIEVSKAQKALEIARRRLNDVIKDRKMHESLKEKAFVQYQQDELLAESKEIDQLVSYTYGTRDAGEE